MLGEVSRDPSAIREALAAAFDPTSDAPAAAAVRRWLVTAGALLGLPDAGHWARRLAAGITAPGAERAT